jgi:hypothetical protein
MSRRLVLSASTALAAAALIVGCGAMGRRAATP